MDTSFLPSLPCILCAKGPRRVTQKNHYAIPKTCVNLPRHKFRVDIDESIVSLNYYYKVYVFRSIVAPPQMPSEVFRKKTNRNCEFINRSIFNKHPCKTHRIIFRAIIQVAVFRFPCQEEVHTDEVKVDGGHERFEVKQHLFVVLSLLWETKQLKPLWNNYF